MPSNGRAAGVGVARGAGRGVTLSNGVTLGGGNALGVPPPPFVTAQVGCFGTYCGVNAAQAGAYRAANDALAGYTVRLGAGGPPDPAAAPDAFSTTLPVSVALTPPASGTLTYRVVVRRRNKYGLESQNSRPTLVTIDSAGLLVKNPIAAPDPASAQAQTGGRLKVLASYPGVAADEFPADAWRVWAATSPPDPDSDPPTLTTPVTGTNLSASLPPLPPGLYYVVVGLYRSSDGRLSDTVQLTIEIPAAPDKPRPVHSGYDL